MLDLIQPKILQYITRLTQEQETKNAYKKPPDNIEYKYST